jgi:hypothetical protein
MLRADRDLMQAHWGPESADIAPLQVDSHPMSIDIESLTAGIGSV